MIRSKLIALATALACLGAPAAAQADFGFVPGASSITAINRDGTIDTQAGSHPYAYSVHFELKTDESGQTEGGLMRDAQVDLPPGFFGNPEAVPACPAQEFEGGIPACSLSTQVGVLRAVTSVGEVVGPVFNMVPPHGVAAELGFSTNSGLYSLQFASLRSGGGYGLRIDAPDLPVEVKSVTETIWGTPADPSHDPERGAKEGGGGLAGAPSDAPLLPFLTLPGSCEAPPSATVRADSTLAPGSFAEEIAPTLDIGGNPALMSGCESVPFAPAISAKPTSKLAASPSGLDFELTFLNQGLLDPKGIVESEPKKVVATLPEGVTINPSLAEGIGVCSPAQYAAEQIDTAPGGGCPEAAKIGSVVVNTPLLSEAGEGSLYLAAPYDNPFGTLAALYMVVRVPGAGVLVKQAGRVDFDPQSGQIKTTFEDLPPLPYSSFKLHFREGGRAPLVTPPACGTYTTTAALTPFSVKDDSEATIASSSFATEFGAAGVACPAGGLPPFHPGLSAGTINNAAASYSPFDIRLTRTDPEQEITHFSIKLPPGLLAKLAGVPFCSDAAIAAAKTRSGAHAGQEEIEAPSCPAASQVGRTLVGVGVGGILTYVPGRLYLAGSYHGSALSIVAVTAAKAGPFDLGTVVIREALKVNPETAEVFVDAAGSDPIPHIIDGIPVHARDIRIYVDRPDFALNPTNCAGTSTASTVLGSGLDFASEADDRPVTVTSPFQAADCASLGFGPKLAFSLRGGTKRSTNPALKAVVTYPDGKSANIKTAQVTLPGSEFLDNEHIQTICTRVQFNAGAMPGEGCPARSVYGRARAITPLLDEPLEGPVFLRSSNHNLPDLVTALHSGKIDVVLHGRIDSVGKGENRRIRNTFEGLPDAPVSKFVLEMQGGDKGLLVNSVNLCARKHRAQADFTGQNGRHYRTRPLVRASCRR